MKVLLKEMQELIDKFLQLPNSQEKMSRQTFMMVSGYPHLENVTSNILAFLFNDTEEHGFSNLWIRSLIDCVPNVDASEIMNTSVNREVSTLKGNRIDLVVYSDTYIICIENKLFSNVHNDLADYSKTVKTLAIANQLHTIDILLTLYDESEIAQKNHFINITYSQLFANVRKHFGEYLDNADNTWMTYAKDFMYTIENLIGGNADMDKSMMQFAYDNREALGKLLAQVDTYKRELKKQTDQIKGLMEADAAVRLSDVSYSLFCYNERVNVYSCICVDLKREDGRTLTVETFCDCEGWHICLFDRAGNERGKQELIALLNGQTIPFASVSQDERKLEVAACGLDEENDAVIQAIYKGVDIAKKIVRLKTK